MPDCWIKRPISAMASALKAKETKKPLGRSLPVAYGLLSLQRRLPAARCVGTVCAETLF